MKIRPFIALSPPPALAAQVASLPYDVGDLAAARAEATANPASFLHVERPEVDLPDSFDAASGAHHQAAAFSLRRFRQEGLLKPSAVPSLFVYQQQLGAHRQAGLVATCSIDDYYADVIRKHEKTKKPTEDDRTRHVLEVGAQTGPIFLLYRPQAALDAIMEAIRAAPPQTDFTAADGIRHSVWPVPDAAAVQRAFEAVPLAYVADGHHRAAAAARAGAELRRAAGAAATGGEPFNWFLSVLFPANQLQVLAYNRMVRDLNGLSMSAFLAAVQKVFRVSYPGHAEPSAPGRAAMYLGGRWHDLAWDPDPAADPVSALDVSVLQDRLLGPVLGIDDPRTNPRIQYAGGFGSAAEVATKVDRGEAAVGFSMHPVTVDQLMAIADADRIMPPKSTWFEPKLRSGLFVHALA